MFHRKKKQLLHDMEHNGAGQPAMATVLTSKVTHHTSIGAEGESGSAGPDTYHVRMRVEPDGGAPFEADVTCVGIGARQPLEGEQLPVRYDPADPNMVVLDLAKISSERSEAREKRKERQHSGSEPDPEVIAQLKDLQARFDRGEMLEGAFRVERAKILGG
jgi:hypothetical protein